MCEIQPATYLVVEGQTDLHVVNRLLRHVGVSDIQQRESGGKGKILVNLSKYNEAAQYSTKWLVVLDLDRDADCAPGYVKNILPSPTKGMMLRIAVRSIEAWLMADRGKMAQFLKIPAANFPHNPDTEKDPKRFLIDLIRRRCRGKQFLYDMLPAEKSGREVGPGYSSRIANYVQNSWRPEVAAQHSDSLARCIRALKSWSVHRE